MSDIVERLRDRSRFAAETKEQARERRYREREEAADTIAALTARVAELEAIAQTVAAIDLDSGTEHDEALMMLAIEQSRAAITKGERTPSFGDFVEGCDYLLVPSTKGESHD